MSGDVAALLVYGLGVGLLISVPPGPVGGVVVKLTLAHGFLRGLGAAAGTVLADTTYAALAGFGVAHLVEPEGPVAKWLGALSIPLFAGLGVVTLRRARRGKSGLFDADVEAPGGAPLRTAGRIYLLTLWSPATLPTLAATFAAVGATAQGDDWLDPLLLIVGIFLGACAWWAALCFAASRFQGRAERWYRRLDHLIGGLFLAAAGVAAWYVFG